MRRPTATRTFVCSMVSRPGAQAQGHDPAAEPAEQDQPGAGRPARVGDAGMSPVETGRHGRSPMTLSTISLSGHGSRTTKAEEATTSRAPG